MECRRIVRAAQRNGMVLGLAAGEVEHHDASGSRSTLGGGGLPHDFNDTFAALPCESPISGPLNSPKTQKKTTDRFYAIGYQFMMGRIFSALSGNISGVLPGDYFTHYMHCVDYLRQAVMCNGDMAMEPHKPTDGPDNGPLDGGWNGMHGTEPLSFP